MNQLARHLVFFFAVTGIVLSTAPAHASKECEAQLALAKQSLTQADIAVSSSNIVEESVNEEQALVRQNKRLTILSGLVIPEIYARTKADFVRDRALGLEILKRVEIIEAELTFIDLPFELKLKFLAERFDSNPEPKEKAAVLAKMIDMFSIPVEYHYINLIAKGTHSAQLKKALYKALSKIFRNDTSWQPPLDRAMAQAGLR